MHSSSNKYISWNYINLEVRFFNLQETIHNLIPLLKCKVWTPWIDGHTVTGKDRHVDIWTKNSPADPESLIPEIRWGQSAPHPQEINDIALHFLPSVYYLLIYTQNSKVYLFFSYISSTSLVWSERRWGTTRRPEPRHRLFKRRWELEADPRGCGEKRVRGHQAEGLHVVGDWALARTAGAGRAHQRE